MSGIQSHKDLRVWQLGIEIVKDIYSVTKIFPKSELYGFTNQLRRAAVSIPANIAEGHSRLHKKEYIQALNIALGSCSELDTEVIIAIELGYISNDISRDLLEKINSEGKQLRSLISKMMEYSNSNT